MYKNTRQPNLTISGASGWCLSFTQDVWGTPHLYPKAIDAWNASGASNHPNEQPPIEVKTIAYWTYRDPTDGIQYGHIATNVPGQGVYTSPFNRSYGYEWYGSIQSMSDRIKRIDPNSKYLGWSESLSGIKLVTKGDEMITDDDDHFAWYNSLMMAARNRNMDREEFKKYFVGQKDYDMVKSVLTGPEAENTKRLQEVGSMAVRDKWDTQIYDLQDKLKFAEQEATDLKAKLALQSEDTQLLNSFGELAKKLLTRWGIK